MSEVCRKLFHLTLFTPTWGAASPTPFAAYMIKNISFASFAIVPSVIYWKIRMRSAVSAQITRNQGLCVGNLTSSSVHSPFSALKEG